MSYLPPNRLHTASIFFLVYLFAYVFSPYWLAPHARVAEIILYAALVITGAAWALTSTGNLNLALRKSDAVNLAVLCLFALALNLRALMQPIPWKGDEEYHIAISKGLAKAIAPLLHRPPLALLLVMLAVFVGIIIFLWRKKSVRLTIAAFAIILLALPFVAFAVPQLRIPNNVLLRYPFFEYWFAAVPPLLISFISGNAAYYMEPTYRILPLASAILLAWTVQRPLARSSRMAGALLGVGVVTVPLVYYYSSILYLELPAVVLMTYACLHGAELLTNDKEELVHHPAWYALLLTGFLKETTVPFIAVFILLRLATRFLTNRDRRWTRQFITNEILVAFGAAVPLFIYIALRKSFGDMRAYVPHPDDLLDLSVYVTLARSYISQLGPMLLLFVAGLYILVRRRAYLFAVFLVGAFVTDAVFHILDSKNYLGYSRFNIFLLPPVLAGAAITAAALFKQRPRWTYGLLVVLVGLNLALSPVYLDGSKVPRWDAYRVDTAEHYYPYRTALRWLKARYPESPVWFTGLSYHYSFGFYFRKLDWHPRFKQIIADNPANTESGAVAAILKKAADHNIPVVVYQPDNKKLPRPKEMSTFHVAQIFSNEAHELIVYARSK